MKIVVAARSTVNHEVESLVGFAEAVNRFGDQATMQWKRSSLPRIGSCDAIAVWGWRQGAVYRKAGLNVLVFERGYVGDRFKWTSIGLNGLNGRAAFPRVEDPWGVRWSKHFADVMQPWADEDDDLRRYTLVMGQVPTDAAVRHVDFNEWAQSTMATLRARGEQVRFRRHPKWPLPGAGEPSLPALEDDLRMSRKVVTFNSNSGVDAVLAGVPTVAMDEGSMAWSVTTHGLDDEVATACRQGWAFELAWRQWLPSELTDGTAWQHVRTLLQ